MEVRIEPLDVWLFRDGRPFRAGEDHLAESLFPPSAFTLQGAIRTKYLVDSGVDIQEYVKYGKEGKLHPAAKEIGFGEDFGKLRVEGPLVIRRTEDGWERLIPMPADVVRLKNSGTLARLQPRNEFQQEGHPIKTNLPDRLLPLWAGTEKPVTEAGGWLPERAWRSYLEGQTPSKDAVVSDEEIFVRENRLGIAIQSQTHTAQTGMLYQVRFVRLRPNYALWAKVEGISLRAEGFLRFGGEARAARVQKMEKPLSDLQAAKDREAILKSGRFRVILVTPAWFSGGWQPKNGDWSEIFGAPVKLLAVALPRPLLFGGFDVARGVPRPIRRFVPPGAVYFFETKEAIKADFSFTETPPEVETEGGDWRQIGLGMTLVGRW